MAVNAYLYNDTPHLINDRTIDWESDTIKAMLLDNTYSFAAAETDLTNANAAEISSANYVAGGVAMTNCLNVQDTGKSSLDAADPSWTALTADVKWLLVYSATASKPLIIFDLNSAGVVSLVGVDFVGQLNAAGLISLTNQ
ncbi:MAG: hypothetical protein KAT62_00795 [Desulfuromonadales bacterium]|nr:hypothetical protein [Desulfuromonadales bacterium]